MSDLINKVKINPNNPRSISDENFKKLKESIKKFPQMLELRPIVYDENFISLGGNMRLLILKELHTEGFEVKDEYFKNISNLTEDQKREFIIKDNMPFGDWDWDILHNEWDSVDLISWGFTDKQLSGWGDQDPPRLDEKEKKVCPECGAEL